MTDKTEKFRECIELMQRDVAEFEAKYQGRFAEAPHVGLGNRKTRCVNEATLPIITCHPSCLEKCAGTCYVINICTRPRPNCRKVEAKNTVLRRIDPNAYYEHFYREAEREAEKEIAVWHCRNCAEHGCGCCGTGDIRFNVVGEGEWALKAAEKAREEP